MSRQKLCSLCTILHVSRPLHSKINSPESVIDWLQLHKDIHEKQLTSQVRGKTERETNRKYRMLGTIRVQWETTRMGM